MRQDTLNELKQRLSEHQKFIKQQKKTDQTVNKLFDQLIESDEIPDSEKAYIKTIMPRIKRAERSKDINALLELQREILKKHAGINTPK